MEARLIAISGPLEGAVFPFEAELSIGRDKTNAISVEDRMLSRHHCLVGGSDGCCEVRDLSSANGTFVNGIPVTARSLIEGDQIRAGRNVFLYRVGSDSPPASSMPLELLSGDPMAATTILVKAGDSRYAQLGNLPQTDQIRKNLEALLNIGSTIATIRGLEALEQKLLESILAVIPGERGAIFLAGKSPSEFASEWHWTSATARPMQVSRTIVDRVIRESVALLSNDVLQDPAISLTKSVVAAQIRSLLAVPLVVFGKCTGAIYLDTLSPGKYFEEDHLQLLNGIAAIAAPALDSALYTETLQQENQRLNAEINIQHDLVGASPRMRQVFDLIAKAAPSISTVLIRGESGTGKELVARAIHRNSPRMAKAFVAINCAALTETLLESELFGHEKGAFTGAFTQKKGKLEEATGGTVFLDELGEMSPALQAKLLRVLQEREFERVGGTRPIRTDIRLIAATHRDLEEAVRNGTFRQDLYYRLNVIALVLPPLRERREDIAPLASYLVQKHARNSTRSVTGISEEARKYLANYDWPGNVRELENAMERAVVLGSTELIVPEDLPDSVVEADGGGISGERGFHELVRQAKRRIVLETLEEAGGSYSDAARRLHLHPSNLHRLIRTLNLKEEVRK